MYLDVVLPKVVDGTWNAKDDVAAVEKIEKEVDAVFKSFSGGRRGGAEDAGRLREELPGLPTSRTSPARSSAAAQGQEVRRGEEVRREGDRQGGEAGRPDALQVGVGALRGPAAGGDKELLALSVKAAEAALKIAGDKDAIGAVLRGRGLLRRRRQGEGQGVRARRRSPPPTRNN